MVISAESTLQLSLLNYIFAFSDHFQCLTLLTCGVIWERQGRAAEKKYGLFWLSLLFNRFLDAYKEISYFFQHSSEILKANWWLYSPLGPLVRFSEDVFSAKSSQFFTSPSPHGCSNPTIVSTQTSSDKFWWSVIKTIRTCVCEYLTSLSTARPIASSFEAEVLSLCCWF